MTQHIDEHKCNHPDCTNLTTNLKYCSHSCSSKITAKESSSLRKKNRSILILQWIQGEIPASGVSGRDSLGLSWWAKNYLFETQNSSCIKCNWSEINPTTGKVPLEINHIDGDRSNNFYQNIELVCPNCHSLTPTHRALNHKRRKK